MIKENVNKIKKYYQEIFPIILIFLLGIISILIFNNYTLNSNQSKDLDTSFQGNWNLVEDNNLTQIIFPIKIKLTQGEEKQLQYFVTQDLNEDDQWGLKIYDYYFDFDVEVNGEVVYVNDIQANSLTNVNGVKDVVIPLNNLHKNDVITITLKGTIASNFSYVIPAITIGDLVSLKCQIFETIPISFYLNIILIAIGMVIFVISFVMRGEENSLHLLNIGLFAFISGVGLLSSLRWYANVSNNLFLVYNLGYFSLLVVTWPILIEIIEDSQGKINKLANGILIYGIITFFSTIILNFAFKIDFPIMVGFIHLEVFLTIVLFIFFGIIAWRKHNTKSLKLVKSLLFLGILVIIDLVRFYFHKNPNSYTTYIEIGVVTTIVIQVYYAFDEYKVKIRERYMANIYRRLAFTDALTGLKSRVAYAKAIVDIEENRNHYSSVHVVSIDLNNLKYNNDNYGHAQGDKLLKMTAKLFASVILNDDDIYRIGGDEFIIFLKNYSDIDIELFQKKLEVMRQEINQHNDDIGIDFAIGIAKFDPSQHTPFEEVINQADRKMYYCKNSMK